MSDIDYDIKYLRERITMDFSDWLDTAEAKALLALYDAKCEELEKAKREIKRLSSETRKVQ